MIPLKDENPTRRTPWVTLLFMAANIAVFIYMSSMSVTQLEAFWTQWAFVPARFLADPFSVREMSTIFTAMFMHAGWLHIAGNMLYLWIFGNNIEDRLGHIGFALFYLTCGVAATFAQAAVDPASTIPNLGASGAVAGTLGAYMLLFPGAAVLTVIPIFVFVEIARVPAFLVIGFWFVLQLFSGLASLGPQATTGGVAFFAHIGGFAVGLLLAMPAWFAGRRRRPRARSWR